MLKVLELEGSAFPQQFLDVLPHHCPTCGYETLITETLTSLSCSNPHCLEKSVQRLVMLLKDLDIKSLGEAKCRQFLEYFEITNPYCIFMYEPDDGVLYEGASPSFSDKFYKQLSDSKRRMTLSEYVKIGNLPGIRDSAHKLFGDYDSLEEFYDDLESEGITFVQDLLGIKREEDPDGWGDDPVSVRAVAVYNTLVDFKEDLFEAIDYVDIKQIDTPVFNICISTAVGFPFKSKASFVSEMNEMFGDKVHLNFLGSVSRNCDFLIWSKEGGKTSKVRKAEALNEKIEFENEQYNENNKTIEIMTGLEFRDYLESL